MATQKKTEYTIECSHKPGELARILESLSGAGVNVLAFCGYQTGEDKANIMLVADDDGKAESTLKSAGITFKTNAVVAVTTSSGAGEGAKLARKLADAGVNLEYAYATTSGSGESTAVFAGKDVEKVLQVLG